MEAPTPFPIVGLGVSAGGIEALEGVFRGMPTDLGMGFVVIAHLAPGRASLMAEILQRFTKMPVQEAQHDKAIEPDHVYVIAAETSLTVKGGRLKVRQTTGENRERHPIDVFFGALAEDQGERALGIVLSGSGSDGTLGVKAIKERGGFTMAQGVDGTAPRHDGMPSSAIASGLVDLVVSAEDVGFRLREFGRSLDVLETLASEDRDAAQAQGVAGARQAICGVLRERLGHDFAGYKEATFMRRVGRRMQVLQAETLERYVERLREDKNEAGLLFRDLLIGVTSFFRDAKAFEALDRLAICPLLRGKGPADVVRVWVPGCATGEEVYSVAILLHERMAKMNGPPKAQLFATDIDEAALGVARLGRYPAALLDAVEPERLERYFVAHAGSYTIAKEIRDMCVLSSHSVTRDPPFSRIDLISCRNLLIYLGGELQERLARLFHYALRPGGFLFLGSSENVTQHAKLFAPVDKQHRLFQRREDAANPSPFSVSTAGAWTASPRPVERGAGPRGAPLRRRAEARVLERFAPAHVIVNSAGEVLHYSARTGKYLEAPSGQPSRQIDGMARKGLRFELRAALKQATATGRPATRERVAIELDDRVQLITLRVEPLGEEGGEPSFLVLFSDAAPPLAPEAAATYMRRSADGDAAGQLEGELREMRERLQSTIEEYETGLEELKSANEELQSANEELQSTNEEFETSKEEIQSVNEELHTVNAELNEKVEELNRANADLRNLFESTQIATIFLDSNLLIRSFTPAVTAIFKLIPTDRGRPVTDIAHRLEDVDLGREVNRVLETQEASEQPVVQAGGSSSYLMRILPYRTEDGVVDGALATFVDVTSLTEAKKAEEDQRGFVTELNHRVRNLMTVVIAVVQQTLGTDGTAAATAQAVMARLQALGNAHALILREAGAAVSLRELFETELAPYLLAGRERIELDGAAMQVAPRAALALGLAAHELATNAAKHGALSASGGRVRVAWRREGGSLAIEWRESGGPRPAPSIRRGFGSKLIERQIAYELDGESKIELPPEGALVRILIPMRRLHAVETDADQAAR